MVDKRLLALGAEKVLVEYLGVAAEFVVDDAIRAANTAVETATGSTDELYLSTFFVVLGGMLPASVSVDAVKSKIIKRYQAASGR